MLIRRLKLALPCALLLLLFTLAACNGGASSPTVSPTPKSSSTTSPTTVSDRGTQLLAQAGQTLNGARTLHAIVDITIAGPSINGTIKSEIWNLAPNKN